MWKLYENFYIFHFQKRIVSAETIRGNMVIEEFSLTGLTAKLPKSKTPVMMTSKEDLKLHNCKNSRIKTKSTFTIHEKQTNKKGQKRGVK